ncbi:hypothetical protein I4U23_004075 [Adineta vaga]|nr:hypothetical protein I4U23_004075 [Adineta vaga]
MSENRSTTKSHDSFNQNVVKKRIQDLYPDDLSVQNNPYYIQLYNHVKSWLFTTNLSNINEKDLQLNFHQNCIKKCDQHINNRLKYADGFKGTIYKAVFGRLMPDFCLVDYYNSHVKSSTSGLDLEFLPLHIVSVLELKIKLKDSDIGQLLHYLRIILDYSPSSRSFILGAITDFHDIQFAVVTRSNNNDEIEYEASIRSSQNEDEHLLHYLTMFLTADLSKFGYYRVEALPNNIRIDNKLLGIGANSLVFNCYLINDQLNEYTLKISNESVDKEVSIYEKLYVDKYKIIQVHQYAFLFLHPPGQILSEENLFNNIHVIWKQIKKAHTNNLLHRDIRRSNIIEIFNNQTKSNEILLIDWHSAIEIGSNVKYSGTLSTASNFILDKLSKNSNETIQSLPIDDIISLMKMILLEIIPKGFKKNILSEVRQHSYTGIRCIYDEMNDYFKNKQFITLQIINLLEKHRESLPKERLNYFIDKCVEKYQCLLELENQQIDVNYFHDLIKEIFPS